MEFTVRNIFYILIFCFFTNTFAQNIVALNSDSGAKMLSSSLIGGNARQFLAEVKYFTYQENLSFCGPTTAVIILNTLGIMPPEDKNFGKYKLFTQDNIFTAQTVNKTGITESAIIGRGLTLDQEAQLLNSYPGVIATAYSTESLTYAQAKKIILKALKSNKQLVVANILRSSMRESGGGHFSPVAAYDAKTNNVLFMDVAAFKEYGPSWIAFQDLYNGMHTKDGDRYRGFILVSKSSN